jgi:hypothetical protein
MPPASAEVQKIISAGHLRPGYGALGSLPVQPDRTATTLRIIEQSG